jgi:hypothetical protein
MTRSLSSKKSKQIELVSPQSCKAVHGNLSSHPEHQKRLATFSIVLGSLYAGVAAMLIFGVVAAATVSHPLTVLNLLPINYFYAQKRLALIRIFSFLSVAVSIIVIASGLMRTILHFMLKVSIFGHTTVASTYY